jgi:preprotein translocase subunit SecE
MGRLLKKKISAVKKKKQGDEKNGSLSPVKSSGAVRPNAGMQKKNPSVSALPKTGAAAYFGKALQFLREVKAELKKVTWPSRKQTVGSTVVVILVVVMIAFFLGVVDIGLSAAVRTVLQ